MFKSKLFKGRNQPYLIAEIGVNHEGSLDMAKKMIKLAKKGGADCVKFQSYKAEKLASKNSPYYWDIKKEKTKSQYKLFKKYDSFELNDYKILHDFSLKNDIDFLTTPFDLEVVDEIDEFVDFHKISSSDLNNFPLIRKISLKKKPIILSTGASKLNEIRQTVNFIREINPKLKIVLMHCVLSYPTIDQDAHLSFIKFLKEQFDDCIIGYSDHTLPSKNLENLIYSYILGAEVIEKHFTLDKSKKGNDHYHSMDYLDIINFRSSINRYISLLGSKTNFRKVLDCEKKSRVNARRNIYSNCDLKKGHVLTSKDIICKRPAIGGIDPVNYDKIIGKKLKKDLKEDCIIKISDLSD